LLQVLQLRIQKNKLFLNNKFYNFTHSKISMNPKHKTKQPHKETSKKPWRKGCKGHPSQIGETARGKQGHIIYRGTSSRMTSDFLLEIMSVRRQYTNIFKEKKICQLRILWPMKISVKKIFRSQAAVADACNPSYLGGWNQEDCVWGQPRQIVLKTPSPKEPKQNELEVWFRRVPALQAQSLEFKPQSPPQKILKDIWILIL
jgi:hypothetical protein